MPYLSKPGPQAQQLIAKSRTRKVFYYFIDYIADYNEKQKDSYW
jgi:hypothetical protein